MEIEYDLSRRIDAAPTDCWRLLTDPGRAHEWLTMVSSARAEGAPGLGRVIHARGGLLGVTATTRQTVHVWEPERRYGWRGEDPFPLIVECTLDEAGSGTDLRVEAAAAPGRLLPLARGVVRRAVRSQITRSADRFQRLVESGVVP